MNIAEIAPSYALAVLDERIDGQAARTLLADGVTVAEFAPTKLSPDQQIPRLFFATFVGVRSEGIAEGVVDKLPHLKAIGSYCLSTNNINIDQATERGIAVFCGQGETAESVAELQILQAGNLLRGLHDQNPRLQAGEWHKTKGRTLGGKVMGVIGCGVVGTKTMEKAMALDMTVLGYDVVTRKMPTGVRRVVHLGEVLEHADVIAVNVPGGLDRPVIGARELAKMKRNAVLINTARDDAVDVKALAHAAKHGFIHGAAVDVFGAAENPPAATKFEHPLQGIPNVYLTSHIGGNTEEGQRAIAESVAARKIAFWQTGDPVGAFNEKALSERVVFAE